MQRYTYFILQSKYLRIYEDSFGTKILRDDCALKIRMTDKIVVKCRANISLIQHFMYWSHLIDRRDGNMDNDFSGDTIPFTPPLIVCAPSLTSYNWPGNERSNSMQIQNPCWRATSKVQQQQNLCIFKFLFAFSKTH